MTEMQAALGLSQMARIEEYVASRHALARDYETKLAELPVTTPWQHPDGYSGLHLYVIRLQLARIDKSHREVFDTLRESGIGVNLHYIPVHRQPYYQRLGFNLGDYPESERYYAEAISLPMYSALTRRQQDTVVVALGQALTVRS
jgi:dTDP-4-amino-4,6-dideoxygalactose transaminase